MPGPTTLEAVINARYQRYQRAVGVLVVVTLTTLGTLLWMVNRQISFFGQTYRLYGTLDNVRHLQRTTPVTLAGLKIGEVSKLTITDYNEIRVDLVLDRDYQFRIRRDSFAQVKTDLLGNAWIEINMGDPDQPVLPDGARIAFRRAPDLDVLIAQAQQELAQVGAVVTNVRALTEELRRPEGGLLGTLNAVAEVSRSVAQRVTDQLAYLDTILRDAADMGSRLKLLLENITQASETLNRSADDWAAISQRLRQGEGVLGALTDSRSALSTQILASSRKVDAILGESVKLAGQLPRYAQQAGRILHHAEQLMAQLDEASQPMPELIKRSRQVAEELDDLLGAVQRSAVVRALSPPPPVPSFLDAPRDVDWGLPIQPEHSTVRK